MKMILMVQLALKMVPSSTQYDNFGQEVRSVTIILNKNAGVTFKDQLTFSYEMIFDNC